MSRDWDAETYRRVHDELVLAANYHGLTTYQDIAVILKIATTGHDMGSQVAAILTKISRDEVEVGRPMLSAVAVKKAGRPGQGFFRLGLEMGRYRGRNDDLFWSRELAKVYKQWKRPLPEAAAS